MRKESKNEWRYVYVYWNHSTVHLKIKYISMKKFFFKLSLGFSLILGEGNGNPLQYSCLENPMDRGFWRVGYSPRGYKESDTTEGLTLSHWDCIDNTEPKCFENDESAPGAGLRVTVWQRMFQTAGEGSGRSPRAPLVWVSGLRLPGRCFR